MTETTPVKNKGGRPRTGVTNPRSIRVPPRDWSSVEKIATAENLSASDVVIDAIRRHIAWYEKRHGSLPGG